MTDFKRTDAGFTLSGVSEVSIPQQTHLKQIVFFVVEKWRRLKEGVGHVFYFVLLQSNVQPPANPAGEEIFKPYLLDQRPLSDTG